MAARCAPIATRPNAGPRKSWAAGDATSRGVRHAVMALGGEEGYPSALSAKTWGFYDVLFDGKPFSISRQFGSYVMEHVLFKVSFPAEFHAQTAVEAAFTASSACRAAARSDRSHRNPDSGAGDPHHQQNRPPE